MFTVLCTLFLTCSFTRRSPARKHGTLLCWNVSPSPRLHSIGATGLNKFLPEKSRNQRQNYPQFGTPLHTNCSLLRPSTETFHIFCGDNLACDLWKSINVYYFLSKSIASQSHQHTRNCSFSKDLCPRYALHEGEQRQGTQNFFAETSSL